MKRIWTAKVWLGALMALLFLAHGRAWAMDTDYKEKINGTMLHFRVRGTDKANPYLVILHGGPGFSSHMFYGWGTSLETALNVVYLDQRGSGESERLKIANPAAATPAEIKDYTVANLLKDIEGVREFLKVDKWYVLGHSWGGMLGLEYVTTRPEHVLGYIHIDGLISQPMAQDAILDRAQAKWQPAADSPDNAKKQEAQKQLKFIATIRAMKPGEERLRLTFGFIYAMFGELYYAKPEAMAQGNRQIAEAIKPYHVPFTALMANEPAVALVANDHYASRDDTPLLSKVAVPTLIINGKQDGLITPKMAELAHANIKASRLEIFDDCGHFPFIEQPKKTTEAILQFTTKSPKE